MGILRDPVWQFIAVIVALIGILVALIAFVNPLIAAIVFIVAIIVLAFFYPKLRPIKTIFFRVISDTTVLSIKEEEEVKNKVKILYEESEVKDDIHLVILRMWNASSEPILPDNYKVDSIKFKFGKEAKILSVQVLESKPPTIKDEIDDSIKEENEDKKLLKHKAGNVILRPIWLNKDNSLTLKILLTKFQEVSTDETRIIVGGYVGDWNNSYYSKIKNLISRILSPAITFISMFLALIVCIILYNSISWIFVIDLSLNKYTWISGIIVIAFFVFWVLIYNLSIKFARKWASQIFE